MNINSTSEENITLGSEEKRNEQKLLNSFELSCHSLLFGKYYKNISAELMQIENYMFTESCYAPCQISGSKNSPKYRNSLVLHEGESFKLVCPEYVSKTLKFYLNLKVSLCYSNCLYCYHSNCYLFYFRLFGF